MKNIKTILRENIPCWYELSWQKKEPAILVKVHRDFIRSVKTVSKDAPIVVSLKEEFGFKDFIGSFEGNFGFDNAFVFLEQKEDFTEFVVKIPKIKKWTNKECTYCHGTGKEIFSETKRGCFHCEGKGKEYFFDWQAAYAISASFTVFTALAKFPKVVTSATILQLMTINASINKENLGKAWLDGEYSIPLVQWLSLLFEKSISDMVSAMKTTYDLMVGLKRFNLSEFKAAVDGKGGWLNIDCPGNACGLNPVHNAGYNIQKGLGYEFSSHNIESPVQQITLIAGLAALNDVSRKNL